MQPVMLSPLLRSEIDRSKTGAACTFAYAHILRELGLVLLKPVAGLASRPFTRHWGGFCFAKTIASYYGITKIFMHRFFSCVVLMVCGIYPSVFSRTTTQKCAAVLKYLRYACRLGHE
jgi:hypothetical protein